MQKSLASILIIDDNEEVLIALRLFLIKHFENVITEKNPNHIPSLLVSQKIDVIILDMNFSSGINSGNEGIYWLREIKKIQANIAVILITAYGDIRLAVKGIHEGAMDFITKPWENEKVLATVEAAYRINKSQKEIVKLKSKQQVLKDDLNKSFELYRGNSAAMQNVYKTIEKVAATDANVLVLGENGTGKEWIAREIHNQSLRESDVFVTVDMAALPESLFESELFGYEQGAFTDAKQAKAGRFEVAEGGTLFLDEIGNLNLPMQAKILTVLQSREVVRLGSSIPSSINVRLITATNKSLYDMVEENSFREDLLYRINTIQIEIPPLRNRVEDIPEFAEFFLRKFAKKYKKKEINIHNLAIDKLCKYPWPGNIREMEHIIEKAVILSDSDILKASDFQFYSQKKGNEKLKVFNLEENEKILISEVLKECNGNLSDSSKRLGITRATLYRKLKKYDI